MLHVTRMRVNVRMRNQFNLMFLNACLSSVTFVKFKCIFIRNYEFNIYKILYSFCPVALFLCLLPSVATV